MKKIQITVSMVVVVFFLCVCVQASKRKKSKMWRPNIPPKTIRKKKNSLSSPPCHARRLFVFVYFPQKTKIEIIMLNIQHSPSNTN